MGLASCFKSSAALFLSFSLLGCAAPKKEVTNYPIPYVEKLYDSVFLSPKFFSDKSLEIGAKEYNVSANRDGEKRVLCIDVYEAGRLQHHYLDKGLDGTLDEHPIARLIDRHVNEEGETCSTYRFHGTGSEKDVAGYLSSVSSILSHLEKGK